APAADEVHEAVDAAVMPRREVLGPLLRFGRIDEIDHVRLDRGFDLGRECVQIGLVATADGDNGSLLGEPPHGGPPDAPCAARDGDYPSVECQSHGATLATTFRDMTRRPARRPDR